jgi:hypothetical protein
MGCIYWISCFRGYCNLLFELKKIK